MKLYEISQTAETVFGLTAITGALIALLVYYFRVKRQGREAERARMAEHVKRVLEWK
jgi:cbb3-type cytochrome oxidase subunit 3